jgi:hypothetical protein
LSYYGGPEANKTHHRLLALAYIAPGWIVSKTGSIIIFEKYSDFAKSLLGCFFETPSELDFA